jgi:hypothetical protein
MNSKKIDSFRRFVKHIPRSDDLTLIVLKGHLLAEEELNEILTIKLRDPKALFDARMSFSQRLAVLKEKDSFIRFGAIDHLNRLRNQLAHNLEPKAIEKYVMTFLNELEEKNLKSEFLKEKVSKRLRRCIALLCGELSGWQSAVKSLQIPNK